MLGTYVYSAMAVRPSRSPTDRIETASKPSESAMSVAAATMSSTVMPGLGPRGVASAAAGTPQSSSMVRRGSPWPA